MTQIARGPYTTETETDASLDRIRGAKNCSIERGAFRLRLRFSVIEAIVAVLYYCILQWLR